MLASLVALPSFLLFFGVSLAMTIVFCYLYSLVTPQDELGGIRNGNLSPTLSLGGAAVGFVLPLSAIIKTSTTILDLLMWGGIAALVQIIAFGLAYAFFPKVAQKVDENCLHAGVYLAFWSIVVGLVNAACLTA